MGEELGARFVMEGGIRKAGSTIRINVQIVDTETGTHLWAETYDRDLDETAIFAIQDDITDRVVATVADPYGVLARSMAIPTAAMDPEEMTAYQAVLRYFLYQQRLSQEDHLIAREALERAVEIEPGYADAWSCLTLVVLDEDRHDFNRRPDALDRALSAARRGVESDPASSFAHYALATVYFYRRDLGSFRANAEKAIKLNRRNGNVVAMLGILYGYSGDWERGVELTTEAMELNPHHPGWYRFTTFFDHYLKGDYEEALKIAQKINMPGYYAAHMAELLAHKRLGNTAAAENAAREMLHAYPAENMSGYGRHAEMWFYSQPDLLNEVISDLRSVGVEVDTPDGDVPRPVPAPSVSAPAASPISADTETQQVAIAVLPFTDMSPDKDQDYFCEGMAEEIMNALVRIEGIRVASRTSAFRARQEGHGLAEIARLLSVGHVLEGSVRTAGSRLRVTAQLTDVASGYQLWSERFDRELEDVFAVQDEIAAGVVEAVEARLAPGARTILARPQARNLEAYRSYLLGQHLRYAKEDHGGAVRAFQEAVRLDPTHAPSWTGLAESLALSAHMSLIPSHEACAGARKALSTALELQGESADGLHGEAFVAFIERRWKDLEAAVRRAIELQPSHVPSLGLLGMCLSLHQKPDEAEPFFERARQVDPLASFPVHAHGTGAADREKATGSPPLRRASAHLREGGRVGAVLLEPGERRPGAIRGRHRGGRARCRCLAPGGRLPGSPGVGTRYRRTEGRSPDAPRRAASAAGGRAPDRLRGLAARRARGDRRGLRGARAGRGRAPALALLHRVARLRSPPGRPAIRGAASNVSVCRRRRPASELTAPTNPIRTRKSRSPCCPSST